MEYRGTVTFDEKNIMPNKEDKFFDANPDLIKKFPTLRERCSQGDITINIGSNGVSVDIDISATPDEDENNKEMLMRALEPSNLSDWEQEITDYCEDIIEEAKQFILKQLKEEYDYLNSDEATKDYLESSYRQWYQDNGVWKEW